MSIRYFIWGLTVQIEQHLKCSAEQASQNQLTSLITGAIPKLQSRQHCMFRNIFVRDHIALSTSGLLHISLYLHSLGCQSWLHCSWQPITQKIIPSQLRKISPLPCVRTKRQEDKETPVLSPLDLFHSHKNCIIFRLQGYREINKDSVCERETKNNYKIKCLFRGFLEFGGGRKGWLSQIECNGPRRR